MRDETTVPSRAIVTEVSTVALSSVMPSGTIQAALINALHGLQKVGIRHAAATRAFEFDLVPGGQTSSKVCGPHCQTPPPRRRRSASSGLLASLFLRLRLGPGLGLGLGIFACAYDRGAEIELVAACVRCSARAKTPVSFGGGFGLLVRLSGSGGFGASAVRLRLRRRAHGWRGLRRSRWRPAEAWPLGFPPPDISASTVLTRNEIQHRHIVRAGSGRHKGRADQQNQQQQQVKTCRGEETFLLQPVHQRLPGGSVRSE